MVGWSGSIEIWAKEDYYREKGRLLAFIYFYFYLRGNNLKKERKWKCGQDENYHLLRTYWEFLLIGSLKKKTSLRYNSHAIQFIHLNFIIQFLLVYLQSCGTITTIHFRRLYSTQKEIPYPSASSHSPFPLNSTSPWQTLICFLTLQIFLFW